MTKHPKDELHHHSELHRAMQAAAENYSMANYHEHFFGHHDGNLRRKPDVEA